MQLCELADRFQIDSVRSKCEKYLQTCVEIPLAERFFFADKHSMKGLIVSIFWVNNTVRLIRPQRRRSALAFSMATVVVQNMPTQKRRHCGHWQQSWSHDRQHARNPDR